MTATSAPPVKKACDACHRRKVRCTGGQPCKNCAQVVLQCTYLAIPQKKGPKGNRAKVISEIRDTQQQAPLQLSPSGSHKPEASSPFDFNGSPLAPSYIPTAGLLTQETVDICIDFFFVHLYPTYPIFDRDTLKDIIGKSAGGHSEAYCLIASLCAFIMIQPGMSLPVSDATGTNLERDSPQDRYGFAKMLINDLLRVRKGIDFVANPTLLTVQTSFFLFSCYFGLEKQNACWYYLREAATIVQLIGMHEETSYLLTHAPESEHRRRTYWLVLVTERAYAIERHKPLTLYATIELPTAEGVDEQIINGFVHLINLFRCIDDHFMALWNKTENECATGWLSQLQQRLVDALPPELSTTKYQAADLKVTQQWLRTIVWQLSIMNDNLSINSPDAAMTFRYPVEIARDLLAQLQKMDVPSMEVHGIGLIEKLFDVACTLTDVIACVPLELSTPGQSAQDILNQFLNLVAQLRGGTSRYLPLLLAKVSENVPSMAAPIHDMPLSIIKQGYAGASDALPTPNMPHGFSFNVSRDVSGRETSPYSSSHYSAGQRSHTKPKYPALATTPSTEHGTIFDPYSPSTGEPMSPHIHQGPNLAPVPRSVPAVAVGDQYGIR